MTTATITKRRGQIARDTQNHAAAPEQQGTPTSPATHPIIVSSASPKHRRRGHVCDDSLDSFAAPPRNSKARTTTVSPPTGETSGPSTLDPQASIRSPSEKPTPAGHKQSKRRTTSVAKPIHITSAASTLPEGASGSSTTNPGAPLPVPSTGGDGHRLDDTPCNRAVAANKNKNGAAMARPSSTSIPPPRSSEIVSALREYQAQRKLTIKAIRSLVMQSNALARRILGWEMGGKEATAKERAKTIAKAKAIVKTIESGKLPAEQYRAIVPLVQKLAQARAPLDDYRDKIEKEMRKLAESLPVYPRWLNMGPGTAAMGLAVLVGELGAIWTPLRKSPAQLWKYAGLAPKGCYAMVTLAGKTAHAIPRERRSAIYTIGDSLIKCTKGQLRKVYLERKAYEVARTDDGRAVKPIHIHRRSQRYMEKRMLKLLWQAWRDTEK